jgi:hypothetical protein
MVPERINCHATYFRIFAADLISLDHRLHVGAHCFFKRALPGYSFKSRNLGTTPGLSPQALTPQAFGAPIFGWRLALFRSRARRGFRWAPGGGNDCEREREEE